MSENIYSAPLSDIEGDDKVNKRPKLVWVIFIFSFIGLFGMLNHFALVNGYIPLEGAAANYYQRIGSIDHAIIVISSIYSFVAALQLFRLKKSAFKLYLGYFPLFVASSIYNYVSPAWQELMQSQGNVGFIGLAVGYIFMFAYIYYAYYLNRKGVLK